MSLVATVTAFRLNAPASFGGVALLGAQIAADGTTYIPDDQGIFVGYDLVFSWEEVTGYAARIDHMATGVGNHRNVIVDPEWRTFYSAVNRNFTFVTAANPGGVPVGKDSAPCNSCGICLPLDQMQIDHVHPQDGPAVFPILKLLRSLGLTLTGPKGAVGQAVQANHAGGGINATGGLGNAKLAKGILNSALRPTRTINASLNRFRRYSTSFHGNAFLSLLWAAPGGMIALEHAARNSFVNLRPLCGSCNRLKWNTPRVS